MSKTKYNKGDIVTYVMHPVFEIHRLIGDVGEVTQISEDSEFPYVVRWNEAGCKLPMTVIDLELVS